MAAYDEREQRVLIYLEELLHERRDARTKAGRGVEKVEIKRDCDLTELEYSRAIGRLEGDAIVKTVARGSVGEYVAIRDKIVGVMRDITPEIGEPADPNISLLEQSESGLYGLVCKASQLVPPRIVAVKIVNPEYGMAFDAIEHARGLVHAGPHPNVVAVHQVTRVVHPQTSEVVDAVVMEWLEGRRLDELLRGPTLGCEQACGICTGIIEGIKHLHSNGVTHSDLHAGNIIVTDHGPRIIDIDYSSPKSLALLTTLGRQQRIEADISQTAYVIGQVLRRAAIAASRSDENDRIIREAKTLDEIAAHVAAVASPPPQIDREQEDVASVPLSHAGPKLADDVGLAVESRRRITLRKLMMDSANSVVDQIAGDAFPVDPTLTNDELRERVANYASAVAPLLPGIAHLAYCGGGVANSLTVEVIDRVANAHEKNLSQGGDSALLALRRYPAILLLYAAGIGAIAGRNYRGLFRALREPVLYEHGRTKRRLWTALATWAAESRGFWNRRISGRDLYFPVSQSIEEQARDPLVQLIPSDVKYLEHFDRFELFASLDHFLHAGRAVGASFMWRRKEGGDDDLLSEVRSEAAGAGAAWRPLKAGLLDKLKKNDLLQVLDEFHGSVDKVKAGYGMW